MKELHDRASAIKTMMERQLLAPGEPEVVDAVVSCCEELIAAGEPRMALGLISVSISRAMPGLWKRRLKETQIRAHVSAGEYSSGLEVAREALSDDLQAADPTEAILLRIGEASCLWRMNRVDEAVSLLASQRSKLISGPDSPILARCLYELSSAELFRGRLSAARAYAFEAIVSARRSGDPYWEALGLGNLARIEKNLCRWASAAEALQASIEINTREAHRLLNLANNRLMGIVLWKRGKLAEAIRVAQECQSEAKAIGHQMQWAYATQLLAAATLQRGNTVRAREVLAEIDVTSRVPESRGDLLIPEYIGDTYLEEGNATTALERYDAVWPLALALVPKGDIVAELRRRRAEAYLLLGRHEDAHQEAMRCLEHCRELGDRYEEAATYRTLASSAAALGRPQEARQWFQQGFAYYDDIETPYEWGKLWMAYGDWLRGPSAGDYGDLRGALEAYKAARDHFDHMGAVAKLKESEARITECRSALHPVDDRILNESEPPTELHRPLRRPRGATELERRAAWAQEVFGLVTRSKVVLDLLEKVAKLARGNSSMLILGESGTGKELVAHGIYKLSGRDGPYMPVNCGALPRDVIESEVFGHIAGAFTGATREKTGIFESCNRGMVFLDEIVEMPMDVQSKLLRFLETGEFRKVGSNRNVRVDTQVIAATNRDPAALEKGEGMRIDLYYRLAHAVIVLPPLRRRAEDIDPLIEHFLRIEQESEGKHIRLSAAARNRLIAYPWPGNVRQLRSTIHRLALLAAPDRAIGLESIDLSDADVPTNLMEELGQAERRRIVEALAQAGGVRSDAARALGMSRTTFVGKMKRYGIS